MCGPAAVTAVATLLALAAMAGPAAAEVADHDPRLRTSAPQARRAVEPADLGPAAGSNAGSAGVERRTWRALAPTTAFAFDAIPRTGANWPADPTGAVSDSWYFVAVNTHYALYDLSGTIVLGPSSFAGLFEPSPGIQAFDPKIVYDPYEDTFVLAFLGVNDRERTSWIHVVSIPDATAEDRSTWCGTRIPGDRTRGDGKQWPDYPGLGFSVDRITLSTNQFNFKGSRFSTAQILSIPKDRLYDCTKKLRFDTFAGRQTRDPDGSRAFTIMPAISVGSSPRAQFLVSLDEGKRSTLVLWRIKLTPTGGPVLRQTAFAVGKTKIAPYGTQCRGRLNGPNTWWDPGDLRLVTAHFDADLRRVYTAHPIARDLVPGTVTGGYVESVIRWYEIRVGSELDSSEVSRKGLIGEPESDTGWPALTTDTDGNLSVTYSQASLPNDECLSAFAGRIGPGGTGIERTLLAPGEQRFEAIRGPERWGDYAAAVRDPVDGSRVVLVNQYARADGGPTTIDWQELVAIVTEG